MFLVHPAVKYPKEKSSKHLVCLLCGDNMEAGPITFILASVCQRETKILINYKLGDQMLMGPGRMITMMPQKQTI